MDTEPSRPSLPNVGAAATRTAADARQVALLWLSKRMPPSEDVVVIDGSTIEFDAGWVFYYQSAEYVKSGDLSHALAGNAPLFVPRDGGSPQFISYLRPVAESLEAYRHGGDTNAVPGAAIELLRAGPDAQIVPAILAIRRASTLGMAAAKAVVDACVAGATSRLATHTVADARALVDALHPLGFVATVTYGPAAPLRA